MSRWLVGSSSTSSRDCWASARAITTRCCSPPDRVGENVFADRESFFQAGLEAVAAEDVDATKEADFLFETFPNLDASRDRRFAVTTYELTAHGWRNAQTVEDLARQLHPEAFE